jgi:dTDP-4-dehydrorhamnose 3,5-epimerase-like enzyme
MDLSPEAKRAFQLQSYTPAQAIDGVELVELKRFSDDGGNFTELGRLNGSMHADFPGFEVRQINYSEMEPGAIKAFHLHRRQTDVWYVPPSDKMLLVLIDLRAGSQTENAHRRLVLGDGASRLVRIPPGVAHGVRNLAATRVRIIYFVDTHFSPDPEQSEEGRLPWDLAGTEIWETVRG